MVQHCKEKQKPACNLSHSPDFFELHSSRWHFTKKALLTTSAQENSYSEASSHVLGLIKSLLLHTSIFVHQVYDVNSKVLKTVNPAYYLLDVPLRSFLRLKEKIKISRINHLPILFTKPLQGNDWWCVEDNVVYRTRWVEARKRKMRPPKSILKYLQVHASLLHWIFFVFGFPGVINW